MSRASKGILEKVLSLCKNYEYGETLDRSSHELPLSGGKIINLKTLQVRERKHKDRWSFELKLDTCLKIQIQMDDGRDSFQEYATIKENNRLTKCWRVWHIV